MRLGRRGVSFLELMLVVAMMGVITTLVLPTGITLHRRVQEAQLRRGLATIRAALDAFHRDWERGCVESDDERGWPDDLESLHEGIEWDDSPACNTDGTMGTQPPPLGGRRGPMRKDAEPVMKVYLPRVPKDPFNTDESNTWDTMGWKARSYDDEPDSTTWGGEGVYDVYSSSELLSLDRLTEYWQW